MNDIKLTSDKIGIEAVNELRKKLLADFLAAFPMDKLQDMTLEQYTNLKKEDSFCYWLESRTYELGSIWGGSSYKFGIYKYQNKPTAQANRVTFDSEYAWYTKYGKATAFEAFEVVKGTIMKIAQYANTGHFEAIDDVTELGEAYRWKIAFLYSNNKLVPIYKKDMLVTLAKHFGMIGAKDASISKLQAFLMEKKGDNDIFDFYEDLLHILKDQSNATTYWIYAPGENASKWEDNLATGTMCIGWEFMGDLSEYSSRSEMNKALQKYNDNPNKNYMNASLALWDFVHKMKVGDIIYAKKGLKKIIGKGIVEGDYYYDETLPKLPNLRKVKWTNQGEWDCEDKNVLKTLTDITPYPNYIKKLDALIDGTKDKRYWWLVASPKIWSIAKMPIGKVESYTLYNENGNQRKIFQNFLDAQKGDLVLGYEATPVKQIVSILEIDKPSDGKQVYFKKKESLPYPIDYSTFKDLPALVNMEFLKRKTVRSSSSHQKNTTAC